jgi:hypothetical protein
MEMGVGIAIGALVLLLSSLSFVSPSRPALVLPLSNTTTTAFVRSLAHSFVDADVRASSFVLFGL